MSITRPCYATREQVKAATDVAASAYADTRIDRAVETGSDDVDGLCHRRFWPEQATRYFDWPGTQYATSWRLWLDGDEAVSVSALVAGGVTIPPSDYFLRRGDGKDEAPYSHIEVDLSSSSAFSSGSTHQRAVAVTGVFAGCPATTAPAGATAEVLDASETAVDVTDSAAAGIGDLVAVDTERMLLVGKRLLTTGQTLQTALTATPSAQSVAVTSGAAYSEGETILLDAERMLILDIAANTLLVRRAYDGSALAAHTGSTIYAPRMWTVVRGAAGTTAASHLTAAPISRHVAPPLVRDLGLAYAVRQHQQEMAAYARVAGTGETAAEATGRGVKAIEEDCYRAHGRKARVYAV